MKVDLESELTLPSFWTERPGTVPQPARRKRLSRLPAVIFEIVRFIIGGAVLSCQGVQILLFRPWPPKVSQGEVKSIP
ncbi:hypothetical protein D3C87_2077150 [compost metagenome]